MQVEILHPVCLILPSTSIAETTPMTRTGDSAAMCSGDGLFPQAPKIVKYAEFPYPIKWAERRQNHTIARIGKIKHISKVIASQRQVLSDPTE
jgi:hypothetical protein